MLSKLYYIFFADATFHPYEERIVGTRGKLLRVTMLQRRYLRGILIGIAYA
jgi:hypothetical protein